MCGGMGVWRGEGRWFTFIPPACTHAEVFSAFCPGHRGSFLACLRDRVVRLTGAFFDERLADSVCDVSFGCGRGTFSYFRGKLVDCAGGLGWWFDFFGGCVGGCCRIGGFWWDGMWPLSCLRE